MGLRNPGSEYHGTRHNVGELVARALAGNVAFKRAPQRISAELAVAEVGGRESILTLPTTYMNESGRPVSGLIAYFKVRGYA